MLRKGPFFVSRTAIYSKSYILLFLWPMQNMAGGLPEECVCQSVEHGLSGDLLSPQNSCVERVKRRTAAVIYHPIYRVQLFSALMNHTGKQIFHSNGGPRTFWQVTEITHTWRCFVQIINLTARVEFTHLYPYGTMVLHEMNALYSMILHYIV